MYTVSSFYIIENSIELIITNITITKTMKKSFTINSPYPEYNNIIESILKKYLLKSKKLIHDSIIRLQNK